MIIICISNTFDDNILCDAKFTASELFEESPQKELNEMEHNGFSSALIKGIVTSYQKIERK